MRSDESQLRHPAERPLFFAYAVLNVLLMAAAVFIIFKGSDWLRAHPRLAEYRGRIRVFAIAAVFGVPAIVFLRNTRHALVRGKSIALSPQQLPQIHAILRQHCERLGIDPLPELYFSQGHDDQFAMKFISDPGKQNGLYWDSPEGQPKSPLGPLVAFASSEGYSAKQNSHAPFHGYYFRMLNKQGAFAQDGVKDYVVDGKMTGGFAFVAYPAEYGNSGVMTFIINQDGVLLQKDLGKTTLKTVTAMSDFDPAAGWTSVGD
jgi:hypothetical protein